MHDEDHSCVSLLQKFCGVWCPLPPSVKIKSGNWTSVALLPNAFSSFEGHKLNVDHCCQTIQTKLKLLLGLPPHPQSRGGERTNNYCYFLRAYLARPTSSIREQEEPKKNELSSLMACSCLFSLRPPVHGPRAVCTAHSRCGLSASSTESYIDFHHHRLPAGACSDTPMSLLQFVARHKRITPFMPFLFFSFLFSWRTSLE